MVGLILHRRPIEEKDLLIDFVCSKEYMQEEVEKEAKGMKKSYTEVVFEKGIQQGIEKGIQQGEVKSCQEAILKFLEARFGKVNQNVIEQVKSITDLKRLDGLIRLAATCESLDDFEKGI